MRVDRFDRLHLERVGVEQTSDLGRRCTRVGESGLDAPRGRRRLEHVSELLGNVALADQAIALEQRVDRTVAERAAPGGIVGERANADLDALLLRDDATGMPAAAVPTTPNS